MKQKNSLTKFKLDLIPLFYLYMKKLVIDT